MGTAVVLYLEDDFAAARLHIRPSSVYFVADMDTSTSYRQRGSGVYRVYMTQPVKLETGAYFDEDKKDIAIRVSSYLTCALIPPARSLWQSGQPLRRPQRPGGGSAVAE